MAKAKSKNAKKAQPTAPAATAPEQGEALASQVSLAIEAALSPHFAELDANQHAMYAKFSTVQRLVEDMGNLVTLKAALKHQLVENHRLVEEVHRRDRRIKDLLEQVRIARTKPETQR